MESNGTQFKSGLKDGIPIGLGYLAVSFTNLTSAGQFAALGIIQAGAPFAEMAVAQLIINLRYCLMSCSLSQKLKAGLPFFHRFLISYGVTDEIFGVSVCRPGMLSPFYSYGLMCVAVPGWTLGTLLGAISGDLLPARGHTARQGQPDPYLRHPCIHGAQLAVYPDTCAEPHIIRL